MELKSIKKSKYQQVSEVLDEQGYITDQETVKIWGDETGVYKVSEHVRKWKALNSARKYFKNDKIVKKEKGHRCHIITLETGFSYKVPKEFWEEVLI